VNCKGGEGRGHGLLEFVISKLTWKDRIELRKLELNVPSKIQTGYFSQIGLFSSRIFSTI
jgi:hypothetical protein